MSIGPLLAGIVSLSFCAGPLESEQSTYVFLSRGKQLDAGICNSASKSVSSEPLADALSQIAKASSDSEAFVFVHGFRVRLPGACASVHKLELHTTSSVPVLFDWRSGSSVFGYFQDERNADQSSAQFARLLQKLTEEVPSGKLNIIAHSMGSRAAVLGILRESSANRAFRARDLILVKPDLNLRFFEAELPVLRTLFERIILFDSRTDRALFWSEVLHGHWRLGRLTTSLPAVQVVDISNRKSRYWGHSMFDDDATLARIAEYVGTSLPVASTKMAGHQ